MNTRPIAFDAPVAGAIRFDEVRRGDQLVDTERHLWTVQRVDVARGAIVVATEIPGRRIEQDVTKEMQHIYRFVEKENPAA